MDMDIRGLIRGWSDHSTLPSMTITRMCPQMNLLRWPEGLYCGEPDIAGCNALHRRVQFASRRR